MSTENVFAGRTEYESSWSVKGERMFNNAEKANVVRARVVSSQYGKSICFLMKTGKNIYLPLSTMSSREVGDTVDINNVKVITLCKEGEEDIVKVDF